VLRRIQEWIALGEAVVFFNLELAREFDYRCKQGGQLASKMRFLSAPWWACCRMALAAARQTRQRDGRNWKPRFRGLPGVEIALPVQTNAVFARCLRRWCKACTNAAGSSYTHVGQDSEARLMCSWDTNPVDVDAVRVRFGGTHNAWGRGRERQVS